MTGGPGQRESPTTRILMLAGQAFALGLTMAWILVPASAIFLTAYGSVLLPVTYIGAAVAGVMSSVLLTGALRRRPLVDVAVRVLAGLMVLLLASWILLRRSDADWVSFALLVLVPIVVPVGFIFLVGQAGLLLDVRALKALYARVVAGFALGFVTGGLAGPPLLAVVRGTEDLLFAATAAAGVFLTLVVLTRRSHPAELSVLDHAETERPTLAVLSRNRYIMLIVAFQMLSAVESQWLDFLVFDRAAQRYEDSRELASFVSRFSAIAYGVDILFLLALAGLLLRRFGLRYGLAANSLAVLTLVSAVVVATSLQGSGATAVFVLIVAARVTDLTFSDGSSRTSLSAAYQAVPTRLRGVAQATVEGLAVPVAIGVSGVVLLVLESAGGTDGLVLPVLTGLVLLAWAAVATVMYREYRVNLVANLRGRTLEPADLTIDAESTLVVIDRLVESADERDVRLGLDILTIIQHPELPATLERLVVDERVSVRSDALDRLVQLAPSMAAAAARDGIDDPSPEVRAASVRVLGAVRDPSDLARIAALAADGSSEVRVAAASALSRVGDAAPLAQVATEIARLARSVATDDRVEAARMLGECRPGPWLDRTSIRDLLVDPDHHVVNAALEALRWPEDAARLPEVARHLDDRWTAGAALGALVRAGDAALVLVDEGLRRDELSHRAGGLFVRAAREIGGASAVEVLRRHVEHPNREIGLAVMTALGTLGPSGHGSTTRRSDSIDGAPDVVEATTLLMDLEHATHVLRALIAFEDDPSATLLCRALREELDLVRQRALAALSMRHGTEGLHRVVFQLAQRDPRAHALALEWLDVTLTGTDRAVIAILEPGLSDRARMSALIRRFPLPLLSQHDVMIDLVQDRDDRWRRPWIQACAIYTASRMTEVDLDAVTGAADEGSTTLGADDEAWIVRETLTGVRERPVRARR